MPSISSFYGITIIMHFTEHVPPHIHAKYAEFEAEIAIEDGRVIAGEIPIRALSLVTTWIELHREDLLILWETKAFKKLPPLQ